MSLGSSPSGSRRSALSPLPIQQAPAIKARPSSHPTPTADPSGDGATPAFRGHRWALRSEGGSTLPTILWRRPLYGRQVVPSRHPGSPPGPTAARRKPSPPPGSPPGPTAARRKPSPPPGSPPGPTAARRKPSPPPGSPPGPTAARRKPSRHPGLPAGFPAARCSPSSISTRPRRPPTKGKQEKQP
jgi:hypothetical protein